MKSAIEFRVQWGDTDPAAITFYPNVFRWFDWGTWNLFARVGLTHDVLRERYGVVGCPIVGATSSFRRPTRFWDEVQLTSFVRVWSRKTFEVVHEVRVNDALCVNGAETRVWARSAPERPEGIEAIAIPEAVRELLPAVAAS